MKPRRWVRNSARTYINNNSTLLFKSLNKINENYTKKQTKHTFFPGNELKGSRLMLNTTYLIDCDCFAKVIWDIFIMILVIILSYTIPFSLSFYNHIDMHETEAIISFLLIDMILTFNTTFYSKGMKIANRCRIFKNYLKTWFWLDLLASFPFELFFLSQIKYQEDSPVYTDFLSRDALRYLLLLKLLRLFKYKKLVYNIQELCSLPFIYNLTSMFTYFYGTSLVLHWITCISNVVYCNIFDTVPDMIIVKPDVSTRYLKIFLRTMETVTGVGYGELPIKTVPEKVCQIFIMTLTSGLLGYIVGGIQTSIQKLNYVDYYFNDIFRKMKLYCELNECPQNLRKRIMNYLRNLKKLHAENLLKEQDVLSLLSAPMKQEVYVSIQGHYLLRLSAFTIISSTCLRAISYKLKLQVYAPNDLIIVQGETTDDLYFIVGGNVEVLHNSTKTMFKLLGKHSFFGEIGFFCKTPRMASVKSFVYSELFKISNLDFFMILKNMPKDYEAIKVLLRNTKKYGLSVLDIRCYLCYTIGHCAINCDKYVFQKNFDYTLLRSNKVPCKKYFGSKVDILKRYNVNSVKGKFKVPEGLYEKKPILVAASDSYLNWTNTMRKKSQHFISLFGSMEDVQEESDNDSDSSMEIYIGYHAGKGNKLKSFFSDSSAESHP